jgi:hypothetical protein
MRIASMEVLPPAQRRELLLQLEARMLELLEKAEAAHAAGYPGGGLFDAMSRGALAMQRTRIEWVRSVAAQLENAQAGERLAASPRRRTRRPRPR